MALSSSATNSTNDSSHYSNKTILSSAASTSTSDDYLLVEDRLRRFMSDNTASTVPLHSKTYVSEEVIITEAKERMAAKLLSFDDAFNQRAEDTI